jgi:hypothetical protein
MDASTWYADAVATSVLVVGHLINSNLMRTLAVFVVKMKMRKKSNRLPWELGWPELISIHAWKVPFVSSILDREHKAI